MKKSLLFMLFALVQMTFAEQLVDGKYVNFEDFVTSVADVNGGNPKSLGMYKSNYVNGSNSTRHYVTNAMMHAAFERARELDAIGVYLPRGVWNFNDQIVVPHGMTLKGTYDRPHKVTEWDLYIKNGNVNWNKTRGTNIACYSGRNTPPYTRRQSGGTRDVSACIALQGNATLDGVNVYYPQQNTPSPNSSFAPVKYPWTISCQAADGNDFEGRCAVMNTTLVNSYAGIDLNFAHDHYIRGVNMTAFKVGIRVDNVASLGSIEDVNMHPQYAAAYYRIPLAGETYDRMLSYLLDNMTGLDFGWADWGWLKGVFIFKAHRGFYFRRGEQGYASGHPRAAASLAIENSGCDNCTDALYVEEVNSGIGVNFTNAVLIGRIYVGDDNHGPIRITNSYLAFDAGGYDKQPSGNVNYYYRNHVEVGKATVMHISNTEIMDFMGDQPKGSWRGSTFDVKGKLLLSNSSLAWPGKGAGFGASALMFMSRARATVAFENLLIRGMSSVKKDGVGLVLEGITIYDPIEYGYHPTVPTSDHYTGIQ